MNAPKSHQFGPPLPFSRMRFLQLVELGLSLSILLIPCVNSQGNIAFPFQSNEATYGSGGGGNSFVVPLGLTRNGQATHYGPWPSFPTYSEPGFLQNDVGVGCSNGQVKTPLIHGRQHIDI